MYISLTALHENSHAIILIRDSVYHQMSTSQRQRESVSGSKTTNVKVVLELLRDVGKVGEAVPYLEVVAGILKTIVEMKQVRGYR